MSLRFFWFDFQLNGKSETMIVLSALIPVKLNASFHDATGKFVSPMTRLLISSFAAQSTQVASAKVFGLGSTQRWFDCDFSQMYLYNLIQLLLSFPMYFLRTLGETIPSAHVRPTAESENASRKTSPRVGKHKRSRWKTQKDETENAKVRVGKRQTPSRKTL